MSNQESDAKMSRRKFLSLTNKAGVALISAGGVLNVINPQKVFSTPENGIDKHFLEMRPIQNKAIVTNKSRKENIIVSSKLTLNDKDYLLNAEGSFLWNLCNGRHNLNMAAEALALKYKKTPAIVESDVYNFVNTLKSLNLVEFLN